MTREIEETLRQGRELDTPSGLGEKLTQAVDQEVATAAAAAAATTPSAGGPLLWVAGAVLVVGLAIVGYQVAGSSKDSPPEVAPEVVATTTDGSGDGSAPADDAARSSRLKKDGSVSRGVVATKEAEPTANAAPGARGAPGAEIYGRVTDGSGAPLAEVEIEVRLDDRGAPATVLARTDADGNYAVRLATVFDRALSGLELRNPPLPKKKSKKIPEGQWKSSPPAKRLGDWIQLGLAADDDGTVDRRLEDVRRAGIQARYQELATLEGGWMSLGDVGVTIDAENSVQTESAPRVVVLPPGDPRIAEAVDSVQAEEAERVALQASRAIQEREIEMKRRMVELEGKQEEVRAQTQESTREFPFSVSAVSPGYQLAEEANLLLEGNERLRVDLVLEAAETLEGWVTDTGENPVEGARLQILGGWLDAAIPEAARATDTDVEGAFRFESLPPGAYVVRVSAPGLLPAERFLQTGSRAVSIPLTAGAIVSGRVVHDDGGPFPWARVDLFDGDRRALSLFADEAGEFKAEALAPGDYDLRVYRGEGAYPLLVERLLAKPSDVHELDLVVPDGVAVEGHILFDEEHSGLDTLVVAYHKDHPSGTGGWPIAQVEGGNFRFEGLPPGGYHFGVASHAAGAWGLRAFEDVQILPGEGVARVEFRYREEKHGTLAVGITDTHGNPVRGQVTMTRSRSGSTASRNTDHSGQYRVELHPDTFRITASAEGYFPQVIATDLVLEGGAIIALDAVLEKHENPADALASLLPADGPIRLQEPIRLATLFEILDTEYPGVIRRERSLTRSRILEEWVEPRSGLPSQILSGVIRGHGLPWRVEQGRLFLEAPVKE